MSDAMDAATAKRSATQAIRQPGSVAGMLRHEATFEGEVARKAKWR